MRSLGNAGSVWVLTGAALFLSSGDARAQKCAAPSFVTSFIATGASEPRDAVVSDFNRDGFPDIAVVHLGSRSVEILWGPNLLPAFSFPFSSVRDVEAGDFNLDGWPDVVASGEIDRMLFVVLSDGTGGYLAPTAVDVGNVPTSLVVGFFDQDGLLDVAVAEEGDTNVAVLRGDGLGGLTLIARIPMAVRFDLVTADVNRDGVTDLLSTNTGSGEVLVALGNGDGTFGLPLGSGAGAPESLVADDFDKDGLIDVVTLDRASREIAFLQGDGSGRFALLSTFPLGGGDYRRLDKGDFDRNGTLDIVVADTASPEVLVFLGDGTGRFGGPAIFLADARTFDVAVADFDLDGRNDFGATVPFADIVNLFTNDFGIPCPVPSFHRLGPFLGVGATPRAVGIADLGGDQVLDFVTANDVSASFSTWRGVGNGTFDSAASYVAPGTPVSLDLANLVGDLLPDIVIANQGTNNLSLYRNSFGSFPTRVDLSLSGVPVQVVAADVNNDGKADLVVAVATTNVLVGLNDGIGNFPSFDAYAAAGNPRAVTVGDFDNDGLPDLAVADAANQVAILRNVGGGAFAPPGFVPTTAQPVSLRAAHLNGDGNLDLVVAEGTTSPTGRVQTLLGNGALGFAGGADLLVGGGFGSPHALDVNDLDGNGTKDIAVAHSDVPRVRVLLGNGAGGFLPTVRSFGTGVEPLALATGDVDRDGVPDILAAQPSTSRVWVLLGSGAGSFGPGFHPSAGADARGVATGDFDLKGEADLVVADADADQISRFLGDGTGQFGTAATFSVAPAKRPRWVTSGDFDNNGTLDVLASAETSNQLVFLPGDGGGSFGAPVLSSVGPFPFISRAADFDFDGNLDVAVISDRNVEVYSGDGSGRFSLRKSLGLGGVGSGLVVDDFDKDGRFDIAATQRTDHLLLIFWGSTITPFEFSLPSQFPLLLTPLDFDAGDLNEDGFPDFLVPKQGSSAVTPVVSTGPRTYNVAPDVGVPPEPVVLRVADFDRDGNLDFVVATRSQSLLSFFMGDGASGFALKRDFHASVHFPNWLAIDDFDMDSLADVVVVPDNGAGTGTSGVLALLNTNCRSRQLLMQTDVSTCDNPGSPFASQPSFLLHDDGQNTIQCEAEPVTASLFSGFGAASLIGATVRFPSSGTVIYTDLGISLPGRRYQIRYAHPKTRPLFGRTFSQNPTVTIAGPPAICQGDSAIYTATSDFDMYQWFLDSAAQPMTQSINLTGILSAGSHTLDVVADVDACTSMDTISIDVTANLSAVMVAPGGPHTVCDTCTGPAILATPTGGGAVAYQWGFRTLPVSGSITPLAGETGATYVVEGSDFGVGTFYLVVTSTPACGAPIVSPDVKIDVTSGGGPEPVIAFTALSTKAQNLLEWATPVSGPCASVRLLRRDDGVFPADPNDVTTNFHVGGADFPCPILGKDSTPDASLSDGTRYFYSAFVKDGLGNFSLKKTVKGRPFDHTVSKVKWAYNTGAAAMAQAGVRVLVSGVSLFIVSNDSLVHGLAGGGLGGTWLANAKPYPMGLPAQVRPPVVPFSVGGGPGNAPNGAVFVASQDGNLYALDADELDEIWVEGAGEILQAAAAGIFAKFGGLQNFLFVGTRNTTLLNGFRAFDVEDGTPRWTFDNGGAQGGDGTPVGVVLGSASVDYPGQRAFFGSRKATGGNFTMWAVDVSGAGPMLLWSRDIGDVDGSPVYLGGSPSRLVVASNSEKVDLLEAGGTGASLWSMPYPTGDGNVKGFAFPHSHSGTQFFMFSTIANVTSIKDNGSGTLPTLHWQITTIPSPSIPLFLPGTTSAIVGGGDGKLYRLDGVDSTMPSIASITIGDGGAAVGPPSFDVVNAFVYVGTEEGVIYAVEYPFP